MRRALIGLSVTALTMLTCTAQASPIVVNGSFEDTPTSGNTFILTSGLSPTIDIPGWTTTSALTILVTGANDYDLTPPVVTSPDGGNFLATDGSFGLGTLTQTLTGLTVGDTYNLSFYQATNELSGNAGATEGQWEVTIGGSLTATNSVTLPNATTWSPFTTYVVTSPDDQWTTPLMTIPSGWEFESYNFVANASSELLGFLGLGAPLGAPPLVLLDGVAVTQVVGTTGTSPAPEPTSVSLLGAGLFGILLASRAWRRRA
jgi:hypothetical protein